MELKEPLTGYISQMISIPHVAAPPPVEAVAAEVVVVAVAADVVVAWVAAVDVA